MDYAQCFTNRVDRYKYAIRTYPNTMTDERNFAIERLDIFVGCRILDIGDSGIFGSQCVSIDFEFANLPFSDGSFDRIIIMAVLHHISIEKRETLYKECMRILAPGGRLVISDVICDSPQDYWLNKVVNRYNSNGHQGIFFNESDAQLMRRCGFEVECERVSYYWYFRNRMEMKDFVVNLFGMDLLGPDENLYDIITQNLRLHEENNGYMMEWQLIYFIATLPPIHTLNAD